MQEETIQFLTEHKKYRVLWWGFGPTLLEDLCREKKFDVTEFLVKRDKYQCTELMIAFGERKIYWWWPWSKKIEDITFDEKSYRRVCEYHKYSWFWQIILGLFTPVLVHRKIVKWINIECKCGGYMLHRDNNHDNAGYLTEEQPTVDFNTVGGTLKSLGFPGLLKQLDDSLELVRKNMRTEEQHRQFVAEIDQKMKKSSLKVHPDKVRAESIHKKKSEEEIAAAVKKAEDEQTALNACRVLIKNTDELFLGYIYMDFQYGWYSRMKINSLGNIKVLNKLNSKILLELSEISKVKQEEIITNINEFLKASDNSLKSFITSKFEKNSEGDFERHRSAALNYLTLCIKGHENLQKQCNNILRECRQDAELKNFLYDSMLNTSFENTRQLSQLKRLKKFAEDALQGKIGRMGNMKYLDEYMVLPFAAYVNTLSVCSIMSTKEKPENMLSLWWLLEQFCSYILSLFSKRDNQQDSAHKVLSDLMFRFCQNKEGDINNKEEGINKVVDSIVTIRSELAERFSPDNYIAITLASCIEESRKLEKRIEAFAKQVQEDLKRVEKIIQDQDKIEKDQEEIKEHLHNVQETLTVLEEKIKFIQNAQQQPSSSLPVQNPQQSPRSSLIDVEACHNQSMSKD